MNVILCFTDWALGAMLLLSETQEDGCDISAASQLPGMRNTCFIFLLSAVVQMFMKLTIQW